MRGGVSFFLTTTTVLVSLMLPGPVRAQNTRIESFSKAKKLAASLYTSRPQTFYCACVFTGKAVDFAGCGYQPKGKSANANRLEWEHVVPAENFGRSFVEWREGHATCVDNNGRAFKGRNCARKVSREFRRMEADLYNLMPESADTNRQRSNYAPGMVSGEARAYGACDIEIEDRTFEPRPDIRGDIARIYFYMDKAYPGRGIVSRQNRRLFEVWDTQDPLDAWERARARRIEELQGNANPFIPSP